MCSDLCGFRPHRANTSECASGTKSSTGGGIMKVSIVGLGKLGAPLLAVLASRGFEVRGVDLNEHIIGKINSGIAPVEEPHLQELLQAHRGRIRATSDWRVAIEETDVTGILV